MIEARHDLGRARLFKAGAVGTPGKRTFRLEIEAEKGSAFVWLEKEQLSALALAVKKFLLEQPEAPFQPAGDPSARSAREPFFEFKVASVGLAHDPTRGIFAVLVYDADDLEKDRATLVWWASRKQVEEMADEAMTVVAAGRPICALCKLPMDPAGHACTRSNGHKSSMDEL